MAWVVDLDGVIWRGDRVLAGAGEAVAALRERGVRVVFFTNNSAPREGELRERLDAAGIRAAPGDLCSSAMAAAALVEPGSAVHVVGAAGIEEAMRHRGARPVPGPPADAVIAGIDPAFTYERLRVAADCIRGGARFVATNEDATYPVHGALLPGAGAIVAAIAAATGVAPEVAGKPHEGAARLLMQRCGSVEMVVGDRPETDGRFAARLGARFGLVLSGVTPPGHGALDPSPDVEASDLLALVREALGA